VPETCAPILQTRVRAGIRELSRDRECGAPPHRSFCAFTTTSMSQFFLLRMLRADIFEDAGNPFLNTIAQSLGQLRVLRELAEAKSQLLWLDQIVSEQHPDEISVLVAEGDERTRGEVMGLNAPTCIVIRVVVADRDRASSPSSRQDHGINGHSVDVKPECFVKR
jgi:hypothetical protein